MKRKYLIIIAFFLLFPAQFCFLSACAPVAPIDGGLDGVSIAKDRSKDIYYHYMKGVLLSLDGDIDGAVEEYTEIIEMAGHVPLLMMELATLHLENNEIDKASATLKTLLEHNPNHYEALVMLGTIYGQSHEFEKAAHCYRKAIEASPDNPDIYFLLSILYKSQNDYDSAREVLEELLKRDFENHMAAYQLAHIYIAMKNLDRAKYWLQRSLTIKPDFTGALKDLAFINEHETNKQEAISLYRRYLELKPYDIEIRVRLGNLLLNEGNYVEAAKEFESVIDYGGISSDLEFSLAVAYFFGKINYDRAIDLFLEILDTNPGDDRARYFLAASYHELGECEKALEQFQSIGPSSDLYASSRIQMALIYSESGDRERAVKIVEETLENRNDDPNLYLALSTLYEEAEDLDSSVYVLERGLEILPGNTDIKYRLGFILEKTGDYEKAIALMRSILEIDPENAEAMNFIGYTYADRGIHLDEAEKLILEALRLKPGSGHIMDSLGWVYFRQERYNQALEYLEKAFELMTNDPVVAEHLGQAYEKTGQPDQAIEMYRKALEKDPDNEDIIRRIESLEGKQP